MRKFFNRFCLVWAHFFIFLGTLTAQDEYQIFLFRVQEVSCSENACSFSIAAGTNVGISQNTSGTVIGRKNEQNPQHEGTLTEKVTFEKILDENTTIFKANLSKKEKILSGDIFVCKIPVKKNRPQNVFFNLVKNGIFFQSTQDEKPYYTYYAVLNTITSVKEKAIIEDMVADIRYVGTFYSKEKNNFPTIEKGKYKGKNVLDAMIMATSAEVYNFLRFVEQNSSPYWANTWKISETYATWLVNGAVSPLSPEELHKQILTATSNQQLQSLLAENNIDDDFLTNSMHKPINSTKNTNTPKPYN